MSARVETKHFAAIIPTAGLTPGFTICGTGSTVKGAVEDAVRDPRVQAQHMAGHLKVIERDGPAPARLEADR